MTHSWLPEDEVARHRDDNAARWASHAALSLHVHAVRLSGDSAYGD